MFEKVIKRLSTMSTLYLTLLPAVIGILIALVGIGFINLWFHGSATGEAGKISGFSVLALMMFSWGFMGLPLVIRKEAPGLFIKIKGWPAILQGVVLMILGWGCAIIMLLVAFGLVE